MVWYTLMQSTSVPLLALIPTTLDRVVVWGALALVISLIAWREFTLPEVAPLLPVSKAGGNQDTRAESHAGSHVPRVAAPEAEQPGDRTAAALHTPGPQEQERGPLH